MAQKGRGSRPPGPPPPGSALAGTFHVIGLITSWPRVRLQVHQRSYWSRLIHYIIAIHLETSQGILPSPDVYPELYLIWSNQGVFLSCWFTTDQEMPPQKFYWFDENGGRRTLSVFKKQEIRGRCRQHCMTRCCTLPGGGQGAPQIISQCAGYGCTRPRFRLSLAISICLTPSPRSLPRLIGRSLPSCCPRHLLRAFRTAAIARRL